MRESPASLVGGSGHHLSPGAPAPPTGGQGLSVIERETQGSKASPLLVACCEPPPLLFRTIPPVLTEPQPEALPARLVPAQEFSTVIPGPAAAAPWSLLEAQMLWLHL